MGGIFAIINLWVTWFLFTTVHKRTFEKNIRSVWKINILVATRVI